MEENIFTVADKICKILSISGVPIHTIACLKTTMINSKIDKYAQAYALGMIKAYNEHGLPGVKLQTTYMILNLHRWSGEEAKECKKVLNRW